MTAQALDTALASLKAAYERHSRSARVLSDAGEAIEAGQEAGDAGHVALAAGLDAVLKGGHETLNTDEDVDDLIRILDVFGRARTAR